MYPIERFFASVNGLSRVLRADFFFGVLVLYFVILNIQWLETNFSIYQLVI